MRSVRRNPLIAALLSLATAGLGQVYNAQMEKAFIYAPLWLSLLLLQVLLPLTGLKYHFWGLAAVTLPLAAALVFSAADAFLVASRHRVILPRPYQRWYVYLLFAVSVHLAAAQTNSIIKQRLFSELQALVVLSGSMSPTIRAGERVIVDPVYYAKRELRRGDVVAFEYITDGGRERYPALRCVALGGDTVEIRGTRISVNGEPVATPSGSGGTGMQTAAGQGGTRLGPATIPYGCCLCAGDARTGEDGEPYWMTIGLEDIRGRVLYIYWSPSLLRIGRRMR